MIKEVFIHIGLTKTGSTTIQTYLGRSIESLKKLGYLFPRFIYKNVVFDNHSIPFRILFGKDSETRFYQIEGHVSPELRNSIRTEFKNQLFHQLNNFDGDKLIISGEGILGFTQEELSYLFNELNVLTGCNSSFKIIVYVRNPIDRIPSNIQTLVKMGWNYEEAYNYMFQDADIYFNYILSEFIHFFRLDNIIIRKYEEEIKHDYGIIGSFLSILKLDLKSIEISTDINLNKSLSYESVIVLSEINRHIPLYVNDSTNPKREEVSKKANFEEIPGQKFYFSQKDYKKIVFVTKNDVDWLKRTFQISWDNLDCSYYVNNLKVWNKDTLVFIYDIVLDLEIEIRVIVLKAILSNIFYHHMRKSLKTYFSVLFKLFRMYLLVLNSRFKKN
jgi:hypothetical protein